MDKFSIIGAWSLGFRFIARHWLLHLLILLGLGIALPLGLQFALVGGPMETVNLGRIGPDPFGGGWLVENPLLLAILFAGWILQVGSYFASWRLGFGARLGNALLYGLLAALVAIALVAVARTLGEYGSRLVVSPDAFFVAVLIFLAPLLFVMALLFVTQAVMVAGVVLLLLAFAMGYGAISGTIGFAATLVGGDGSIAVLLLVLSGILFWLAARLCCTTSIMADRGSLNIFAAIRDSWRMTLEDQAAITRYLFLVGAVLGLVVIGLAVLLGEGMRAIPRGGVGYTFDIATLIPRLGLAVPLALLTVMIPAGIYRLLTDDQISAEVFD
ncbi:MAG TPA: hypothetical protein VEC11_16220 [Allosphingosinicella sp.]|nr:hypothetical protein [Allosphingosinicella sp.]